MKTIRALYLSAALAIGLVAAGPRDRRAVRVGRIGSGEQDDLRRFRWVPEEAELLAEMVQAAVNEALRSAQELASSKMGGITGQLGGGLPGM